MLTSSGYLVWPAGEKAVPEPNCLKSPPSLSTSTTGSWSRGAWAQHQHLLQCQRPAYTSTPMQMPCPRPSQPCPFPGEKLLQFFNLLHELLQFLRGRMSWAAGWISSGAGCSGPQPFPSAAMPADPKAALVPKSALFCPHPSLHARKCWCWLSCCNEVACFHS